MMRFVLLGPPGCGKGTQGERLSKRYKIPQISTGEILRAAMKNGTPLGKKATQYMERGELVPSDLVIDLVASRIAEADCKNGYILDGFPRSVEQARGLDKIFKEKGLKLDMVVNITVPEMDIVKRLSGRRVCSGCGSLYHVEFSPAKKEGICNKCSGKLYQRDDDKEATIKNRLKVYRAETAPLIDYYKDVLKDIDGRGNPGEIFNKICSLIG